MRSRIDFAAHAEPVDRSADGVSFRNAPARAALARALPREIKREHTEAGLRQKSGLEQKRRALGAGAMHQDDGGAIARPAHTSPPRAVPSALEKDISARPSIPVRSGCREIAAGGVRT